MKIFSIRSPFTLLLFLCFCAGIFGQTDVPIRSYTTQQIPDNSIKLDGLLNDEAWNSLPWAEDFTEHEPDGGSLPSQKSAFKIAYDSKYLYLALRAYDTAPDSIDRRMGRRDEFPGDWMEVHIDSYNDKRTGFSFTTSVSGVRSDEFISQNGDQWDESWNPIWNAKTNIDSLGWTGEAKIPLSQLRFDKSKDKVWGIQMMRRLFRKEERSTFQFIPRSYNGWVSHFAELKGLQDIPFRRQVELAPYTTASVETYPQQAGNPFADGTNANIGFGIDGKVAITNDLILDFTVNPDFGQVEADPSQVRLDGFENFFQERRPFFVESRNIFDYSITQTDDEDLGSDILFYSRRIGGAPHGSPNLKAGEYGKSPARTTILGAAKFSGKTKNGLSVGLLNSFTQNEYAEIDINGQRRSELIEPATNYFVSRIQKDYNGANTIIGGILTSVNRTNDLNGLLHKSALSGGIDFSHFWKDRAYFLSFNQVMSNVSGSSNAIFNTQTSIEHLFQRPGATEFKLIENATSLTGMAGTFNIGKLGGDLGRYNELITYNAGITYRTPQFEVNDIGYMLSSNEITHFGRIGIQKPNQFSIFRSARFSYSQNMKWDFSGRYLFQFHSWNSYLEFKNNWNLSLTYGYNPYDVSNSALRGGPTLRKPSGDGIFIFINSDSRKKVSAELNVSIFNGEDNVVGGDGIELGLNFQILDALSIKLSAGYDYNFRKQDQYVDQVKYNNSIRYIVAGLDQKTLSFTGRLNYNITPDMSIQYYGQPFITRPLYENYAFVSDPLNKMYDARFTKLGTDVLKENNETFNVDENKDGKIDYSFAKPDFNFVQFRSNLVFRYEYKPGSEAYLVWSQNNSPDAFGDLNNPLQRSLWNNAFTNGTNIFLMKFTYRLLK
jgi:hypothetical protein